MNISYNNFTESADRYLRGLMSVSEREAFENRLATDSEFRQMFEQHSLTAEGLQRYFFREKVEAYIQGANQPETVGPVTHSPGFSIWKIIGVVAVLLLILALGWMGWQWSNPAPEQEESNPAGKPGPQVENYQQTKDEPLAGDPQGYTVLKNDLIPVREIIVENGHIIAAQASDDSLRLIIKQHNSKYLEYSFTANTVNVLLPALEYPSSASFALLGFDGQKSLYLRLENQWYQVSDSQEEKRLTPEHDKKRLQWLNRQ